MFKINVDLTECVCGKWQSYYVLENEIINSSEELMDFIKKVAKAYRNRGKYAWTIENADTWERIAHRNQYDKEWILDCQL